MAVLGTATLQLRLASMLTRANIPIFSVELLVTEMRTRPSWVARSISGYTSLTRPTRSGMPSRAMRAGGGGAGTAGLSFGRCTAGTSASSSISLLMAMRNIGPACGEAGAPIAVLTSVISPAAGARSEIGPLDLPCCPGGSCGALNRANSWFSVTRSPSLTKT